VSARGRNPPDGAVAGGACPEGFALYFQVLLSITFSFFDGYLKLL